VLAIKHPYARPTWIRLVLAAYCAGTNLTIAAAQSGAPSTPRLDNLPVPSTPRAPDIGAIASGYEAMATSRGFDNQPSNGILIMVSFSMPKTSLARLADQAKHAGGVLVLNGLKDGSLPATAQAVHQTFGKDGAPLQIDPRIFTRYAVSTVPTFVLLGVNANVQSCAAGTCPADGYVKVSGDVSLDYALEQIANAQPGWRPTVQSILRRLGK
jgi:conjugal transfer pilus assembly protein TrbC